MNKVFLTYGFGLLGYCIIMFLVFGPTGFMAPAGVASLFFGLLVEK
jgi:hypothetical protein